MLTRAFSLYKTSFTGLSRENWLLSLVMLINRSGTMVIPFMTLYLTGREMHRTLSEAGFVLALFGCGAIAGAFIGGKLSDKIGFQRVQILSLLFGGVFFIVLGQVKSFPLICVFAFILSLVNESFRPANSTAIAHYSKAENRTRSYSLNRLAINMGWTIGGSLGGILASINYNLLFWVDGLTNISAAAMLFYMLPPQNSLKQTLHPEKPVVRTKAVYADRVYMTFIALVMLYAFCFFQLFTTIPKFFRDNLHLSERFIGFSMALNGALIVVTEMVIIYYLEKRGRPLFYVGIGVFVCSLSFLALLLPGNGVMVALTSTLLVTIGEIIAMPFMASYWTLRADETNRGQYAALFTMAWGTAQTLGPFLASLLADKTSFGVLFATIAALLVFIGAGFFYLNSRTRK